MNAENNLKKLALGKGKKHKIKEGAIFFDKQTRNVKEIKNIQ
jgi:hypothetical protein